MRRITGNDFIPSYSSYAKDFSECAGECPSKDSEQNFKTKPVIALVFKCKFSHLR